MPKLIYLISWSYFSSSKSRNNNSNYYTESSEIDHWLFLPPISNHTSTENRNNRLEFQLIQIIFDTWNWRGFTWNNECKKRNYGLGSWLPDRSLDVADERRGPKVGRASKSVPAVHGAPTGNATNGSMSTGRRILRRPPPHSHPSAKSKAKPTTAFFLATWIRSDDDVTLLALALHLLPHTKPNNPISISNQIISGQKLNPPL